MLSRVAIASTRASSIAARALGATIARPATAEMSNFLGASSPITDQLKFKVAYGKGIPVFRIMDKNGDVTDKDPELPREQVEKLHKEMHRLSVYDEVMYDIKLQGHISFYMTSNCEEGIHMGCASALDPEDEIFAQYREAGVLLYRGYPIKDMVNQCYGNSFDSAKGRQMPVHYGSPAYHFQTVSSPLTTQLPQAAGYAYAQKLAKTGKVTCVFFGEGAASEGDFHAGMNFASTLDAPCIFFCRNNGYAISTPVSDQYRGDGIAGRGPALGIHTIRVDGNDIFAVHEATKAAREFALENNRPVLIEAMSYRGGHHSTSDDSTRYRSKDELEYWSTEEHPIPRLEKYMENKGWWTPELTKSVRADARSEVLEAIENAETAPPPGRNEFFHDVLDEMPWNVREQMESLDRHMKLHPSTGAGSH